MNTRSYKRIFFLLSACVLSMLAVQAYWLHNFYLQKTEEFHRTVYDAIDEIGTKLRDRKNIESLRMTYFIQNGDTIAKTPARNKIVVESEDNLIITNQDSNNVKVREIKHLSKKKGKDEACVIRKFEKNTSISFGGEYAKIILADTTHGMPPPPAAPDVPLPPDMKKVIDKMMTEIIILDTETRNADTIQALIKRALGNRGLFLPFGYSLQQNAKGKKAEVLATSKNYEARQNDFKSDLSGDNILPTREILFLQFNNQNDFVMAGMKRSIALSLFLSLLILSVFYYVLRLIRQQKKLSDLKNDFVNNMTHELKTPIATISLALDAMNHPSIKNDAQRFDEYSRILKEENKKLNRHVESVLQISQLENGKTQLKMTALDVVQCINNCIQDFALRIKEKEAQVVCLSSSAPIVVMADLEHLKSVFYNLLDNALKYGGKKCHVKIEVLQKEKEILILFSDNGRGFEAKHREKIFEKFYRIPSGDLHDVKGFGLGLSYVKNIITLHGGTIGVQSEIGKGTTLTITLQTHA